MMMTREEYYAQIKEMYVQKYESKDKEEYYAQIKEMYVQKYESKDKEIEAEDRRFREYLMLRNDDDDETWTETDWWYRSRKENPEDQICNDEELAEIEAESREGLVHKAILEKESIPQVQVTIANSEIVRSIEPGKVDLGLEKEEYVVLNENLEQEWDQKNDNKEIEVDGDIERDQKMIRDAKICCAHKVFGKMPSREKRIKHLKGWKFKFKRKSLVGIMLQIEQCKLRERRRRMYNKVSTNIKDESTKERIAGNHQRMVRQLHKSRVQCKMRMMNESWSMRRLTLKIMKSHRKHKWKSKIYGCEYKNHMLLLGYHCLEVQVLSCLQEFGEGSKTIMLCWKKLASFLWFLHGKKLLDAGQKMQSMLVSDFKTWVPHFGYELCLAGTDHVLGLVWSSFESDMSRLWRGPEVVLLFNSEDLVWFFQKGLHKLCLDIRRMIILLCSSADYRKLNLWVDTNDCEIQTDKTQVKLQEMSCFLSVKSLVEFVGYKAHGRELLVMGVKQLTMAATKFHLKHKWRSRLSNSFSEMKQRMIGRVWKSFGYLMVDMMEEDQKQQGDSELLVIVLECLDAKGGVGMDKKPFHLSLRKHRVWDPGG